jgi:hypothetical protein
MDERWESDIAGWYEYGNEIHKWDGKSKTFDCGERRPSGYSFRYYPNKEEAGKGEQPLCAACAGEDPIPAQPSQEGWYVSHNDLYHHWDGVSDFLTCGMPRPEWPILYRPDDPDNNLGEFGVCAVCSRMVNLKKKLERVKEEADSDGDSFRFIAEPVEIVDEKRAVGAKGWYLTKGDYVVHYWNGQDEKFACNEKISVLPTKFYSSMEQASESEYYLCAKCAFRAICL